MEVVAACCCLLLLVVSSSSWGLGRAAVCDCGTPWTFLLPLLHFIYRSTPTVEVPFTSTIFSSVPTAEVVITGTIHSGVSTVAVDYWYCIQLCSHSGGG